MACFGWRHHPPPIIKAQLVSVGLFYCLPLRDPISWRHFGGNVTLSYQCLLVLRLAELENRHLHEAWRKKLRRRMPVARLVRLAVDKTFQNKPLGELLLIDALMRSQSIYIEAGGIGLLVDVIDEQAAG